MARRGLLAKMQWRLNVNRLFPRFAVFINSKSEV